jgi:hypothetical protein
MTTGARCLLGIIVTAMTAWGAGAIYYSPLPGRSLRLSVAALLVLGTSVSFLLLPSHRRALVGFFVGFTVLLGYVPDYLYELGRLDTFRTFAELERLSLVNARANAADHDPAFSQRIREGLPQPAHGR